LKAIYLSGWQVAADANVAGQMYPDQSLYPANSVPGTTEQEQFHAPPSREVPATINVQPQKAQRRTQKVHNSRSNNLLLCAFRATFFLYLLSSSLCLLWVVLY